MQKIINVVKDYLMRETNNALLITGEWGVGKTYFFNNILSKEIEKTSIKEDERVKYKSIRVSLFGVTSIDDIGRTIFTELFPFIAEGVKIGKNLAKLLLNIPIVKEFIPDKIPELIGEIETDEVKNNMINSKADRLVICFDDLERISGNFSIESLIGYVNNLTENYDFKVIIIGNTDKIKGDKFNEIKEKLIGREIEFKINIEEVFDTLIQNEFQSFSLYIDFLEKEKDFICSFFQEYRNIRTLKFVLRYYHEIHSKIEEIALKIKYIQSNKDALLKDTLLFTICISIENREGKLLKNDKNAIMSNVLPRIDNISNNYSYRKDDNVSNLFKNIKSYYNGQVYFFYQSIFDYILGVNTFIEDMFVQDVREKYGITEHENITDSYKLYNKLISNYIFTITDKEYNQLLIDILNYVDEGEYKLEDYHFIYQYVLSCNNPLEFIEEELKERFINGIKKAEDKIFYNPNLENEYNQIKEYNKLDKNEEAIVDFCLYINDIKRKEEFEREIKYLRDLLKNKDFGIFEKEIKERYKDISVFKDIGAELVFNFYCENHIFRSRIFDLFSHRYKKYGMINSLEMEFIKELEQLMSIKAKELKKGIEWNSFNNFQHYLKIIIEETDAIRTLK